MNRLRSAALAAVAVALAGGANTLTPGSAQAAPADVHVRIEGVFRTIYDRVARTDGHAIRATSDTTDRRCDGTNADRNATPGPTATGAAVDAMTLIGQTFDADWYRGFDDYFITQFADEAQDSGKGWFWGILVNRVFTPVGGCQFQVKTGDEVLWINNGFNGRPFLELSGPAQAIVGTPVTVNVAGTSSSEATTGTPKPYAGATVAPVDADGQPAAAGIADPATSAAGGQAQVTFAKTGWQRLKARHPDGTNAPKAIASNSIDICVKATATAPACAGQPPSQVPAGTTRPQPSDPNPTPTPTPTPLGPAPTPAPAAGAPQGESGQRTPTPTAPTHNPVPTTTPAPKPVGPAARAWTAFLDDRDPAVKRVRGWAAFADPGAWQGTALRGRRGAALTVRLPAGRPVALLRGVTRTARIELRAGKVRQRFTVRGSKTVASRGVALRTAIAAGTVTLKVLDGSVRFDGAGVT